MYRTSCFLTERPEEPFWSLIHLRTSWSLIERSVLVLGVGYPQSKLQVFMWTLNLIRMFIIQFSQNQIEWNEFCKSPYYSLYSFSYSVFALDLRKSSEDKTNGEFKWSSLIVKFYHDTLLAYQLYLVPSLWPTFCLSEGVSSRLTINLNWAAQNCDITHF